MPSRQSDDFFATARKRRKDAEEFWRPVYNDFNNDMRMVHGDQWDDAVRKNRENTGRPALQFNELRSIVDLSVNEARENPTMPKVNPVDQGASEPTAKVLMGIIRHINYASQGDLAREMAVEYATTGGFGYYGLATDYVGGEPDPQQPETFFNQEIKYRWFLDPTKVLPAPNPQEPDFSDCKFWFVQRPRMPWDEYREAYPKASITSFEVLGKESRDWGDRNGIDIAEYWQVKTTKKRFVLLADGSAGYADQLGEFSKDDVVKEREDEERSVVMDLINGTEKLQPTRQWPTEWVPLNPVLGKQVVENGKLKLISIVRNLHDAQKLENGYQSGIAENIGLTNRVPYLGLRGKFGKTQAHQNQWSQAHLKNPAFLEFDPVALPNGQIDATAPQRNPFEPAIQALTQGNMFVMDFMRRGAGYLDAVITPSAQNNLSGIAVKRRQDQTSKVNYHFLDNLRSRAIWHEGRMLLALIPEIYDTPRVQRILGEDGKITTALITQALGDGTVPEVPGFEGQPHHRLDVGRYDVTVSAQPSYQNRLEEELDLIGQASQQDPNVFAGYADLIFKIRGLSELEERAKLLAPPAVQQAANGQQPLPPQAQMMIAQAQQQNVIMKQALTKLLQERAGKMIEMRGRYAVAALQASARSKDVALQAGAGITEAAIKAKTDEVLGMMDAEMSAIENMLAMLNQTELAPDPASGPLGLHPDKPLPTPQAGASPAVNGVAG